MQSQAARALDLSPDSLNGLEQTLLTQIPPPFLGCFPLGKDTQHWIGSVAGLISSNSLCSLQTPLFG